MTEKVATTSHARRTVEDVEFIDISNRFNAESAPSIRHSLQEIVNANNKKIAINLENATFVDSVALSVLLSGMKAVSGIGGEIILVNISEAVRPIIELTCLHRVFRIADDDSSAIAKFESS